MYDFYDLKPRNEPRRGLPTDAINYNGHWLDSEIDGFRTLTVSGRESLSRQLNSPDSSGDGSIYLSSRLESRKIEVEFELNTKTVTEFNLATTKLAAILYEPNVKILFNDDKDFHYVGSVTSYELDKPLLTTKGKIEIECPDPFKYSEVRTLQLQSNVATVVDKDVIYPQLPKTIEFVPSANISSFWVTCMGKKITLNETVAAGVKILLDFENLQVKVNDVSRLMSLDLNSNFSDFRINNGAVINFSNPGSYKIKYEVKRL